MAAIPDAEAVPADRTPIMNQAQAARLEARLAEADDKPLSQPEWDEVAEVMWHAAIESLRSIAARADGATTQSPWLSPERVANYLDVSVNTVYAWRHRGVGPVGHRVGRHVRYHVDDVDAWVRSGDHVREVP